jgi:hypothetical protein
MATMQTIDRGKTRGDGGRPTVSPPELVCGDESKGIMTDSARAVMAENRIPKIGHGMIRHGQILPEPS